MKLRWLVTLLLPLVAAATAKPASAQRRYTVDAIKIDALVQVNGSISIRESLTYDFAGRYRFAFRDIPRARSEDVRAITVSEQGRPYTASASNTPGTFEVTQRSGSTRVTWYYEANDERRTFDLSYVFEGGIHRYPDTAELYYKFVGDEWDRSIGRVSATVRFPAPLTAPDLRAWGHGPLNGVVQVEPTGAVTFEVSPLPARRFWEGRILFPASAVAELSLSSGEPRLDRILSEEKEWAEQANARRAAEQRRREQEAILAPRREALARRFGPISIGLAFAGIALWLRAYRIHGRPHDVQPLAGALGPVQVDSQAWGRYHAASVVLGVHRKLLPKLQAADGSGQEVMPGWYWFDRGHASSFAGSRSSLSDSVSSMVSSLSSSMSSATGDGGGASAGGGGGAG